MRLRTRLAALAAAAAALAACSSSGPTTDRSAATDGNGTTTDTAAGGRVPGTVPGPDASREVLPGFEQVTVRVTAADGTVRTWCLLLARSEAQRARGLMGVTDPGLGGHAGMLFTFDEDSTGGFWMRNTLLPLSIAYLAADGTTVSTADMVPCPADQATCPTYAARGPYRYAVEVPRGRLGDLGISDRSRLEVVGPGCS